MRFLKGFNWYLLVAVIVICGVINFSFPVFGIVWTGTITVPNPGGPAYTYPQIQLSINNTQIIAAGYCDADELDVLIKSGNGTSLPMMPTDTTTWFTTPSISGNSYTTFTWTSDNPAKASHQILVGNGGNITTGDDPDLELANNFILIIDGYFSTSAGSNKNVVIKPNGAGYAFKLYSPSASNLTAAIDNGASEASMVLASGEYEITVLADTTNLYIYVDGVLGDSSALGGASVPDTADNYTWIQNNVMPYINSVKVWTR